MSPRVAACWTALLLVCSCPGGENEFGAINRVELFRDGKRRQLNLREDQFKHVPLRENDKINVPQKNWIGQ